MDQILEQGDRIFFITKPTIFDPSKEQIDELAFSKQLTDRAPNPRLLWMHGQYVEGDTPNENGQMWRSGDLALTAMTPMFCPVTVMHDPRTAVGLIADTKLLTPEKDKVPRAKLDTTLAIWEHRFPEVAEEARINFNQGTLMQSMEAFCPSYDCGECGQTFHKLPGGAEEENWCAHLKGEDGNRSPRILSPESTFTGSGLIFGTRGGARGANPNAHLKVEEVAAFHDEFHHSAKPPKRTRTKHKMETIEIAKTEYDRLTRLAAQLEEETAKRAEVEKTVETQEADKAKAEKERDDEKSKREAAEKVTAQSKVREDRLKTLGTGFTAKLGEKTKERLNEQASTMSDEDWVARLEELEEAYGVKQDAKADEKDKKDEAASTAGDLFTPEEVARSGVGPGRDTADEASEPSPEARRAVMRGLMGPPKPAEKGK